MEKGGGGCVGGVEGGVGGEVVGIGAMVEDGG